MKFLYGDHVWWKNKANRKIGGVIVGKDGKYFECNDQNARKHRKLASQLHLISRF